MRFHLDEHVDHGVARGLRARGIDVTTSGEAGLLGADDRNHLEYALRERRVIYTNDADFLRLAQQGQEHAGLVYAAPGTKTVGEVIRFLSLLQDCLTEQDMRGKIEFL